MPNLFLGSWAVIVLAFLFLTTRRPPDSPSPALVAGDDGQLTFFEAFCERVDPMADIWDDTGHIRTRSDTH